VPSLPLLEERPVPYDILNPFRPESNQKIIHPRLRTRAISLFNTADRAINGLVKFRLHVKNDHSENFKSRQNWLADAATTRQHLDNPFLHPAPNLPPDFGRGIKMDATDAKLLKFCTSAGDRHLHPNDSTDNAPRSDSILHRPYSAPRF
jgi:hypothetical protein